MTNPAATPDSRSAELPADPLGGEPGAGPRAAETGVDIISVGALTHSTKALDISLDIKI